MPITETIADVACDTRAMGGAATRGMPRRRNPLAALDRRIVMATQSGLLLDPRPYGRLAEELGVDVEILTTRLKAMLADGTIRRIAAVPNHFRLGYTANGMSVWDVCDRHVDALGEEVGRLGFVSHCYRRPRHPPVWPYNLFAMVHGRSREEVNDQVGEISRLLGGHCRASDILLSKRILKKTGLRFVDTRISQQTASDRPASTTG